MTLKDIVIPVLDEPEDEAALAAVQKGEIFAGAHVAALLVAPLPEFVATVDGGMSAVLVAEAIGAAREKAQAAAARLKSRGGLTLDVQVAENWGSMAVEAAVIHARHVDLAVMALGKPGATSQLRREVLENVLMDSGRAVLAIPQAWRPKPMLTKVMIAWDAGREAVRAVAEAEPFLAGAKEAVILTVDARPTRRGVGEAPGADIATHLARRGYNINISNIDGMGKEPGEAILSAAMDQNADLVVMGAYGHARLQQAIFGGVTRTLVETSPIPLLLAH